MGEIIVYDKAKYHYDGKFSKELPIEQAFVHTGMFFGWTLENDLYDPEFWGDDDMEGYITSFKLREMTGAQIYEVACDGAFVSDELNEEGNAFAQSYFDFDNGQYLSDYEEILAAGLPSLFHVEDSWENYDKIAKRISERYAEWKQKQSV